MTEINLKNRQAYLDICKTVWDLDEQSLSYIEKRTSDEWEPVPELKALIGANGSTYEDQRIRYDMNMGDTTIQSFFENDDTAYHTFCSTFRHILSVLKRQYSCNIGYKEFIENKVIFQKNQTKIKKVFEIAYAANKEEFESDSYCEYSKEKCAEWIVKKFEVIGASKKSAKKLQFVISFNPMDWLLASTAEKFSSCFNLNNESGGYQYCLGLPFLAGDKNRMMLYITDGSKKEFMGIKVDSVQTRTWCLLDKSGNFNIVKWYPNDTVGVNPVVSITKNSKFKNRDTFSKSKYNLDIISTKKGAVIGVYSDMGRLKAEDNKLFIVGNGKDGQQIFTKNLIDVTGNGRNSFRFGEMEAARQFGISGCGYRVSKWKQLGLHLDLFFPTLRCKKCGQDKAGFLLRNENGYLCYDCYKDSICICEQCSNEFIKTDKINTVETTEGKIIKLCPSCYAQAQKRICSCCGKYSKEALTLTADGQKVCKSCLESGRSGYYKCDDCQTITKDVVITFNTLTNEKMVRCKRCAEKNTDSDFYQHYFGKYFCLKISKPTTSRKIAIE